MFPFSFSFLAGWVPQVFGSTGFYAGRGFVATINNRQRPDNYFSKDREVEQVNKAGAKWRKISEEKNLPCEKLKDVA